MERLYAEMTGFLGWNSSMIMTAEIFRKGEIWSIRYETSFLKRDGFYYCCLGQFSINFQWFEEVKKQRNDAIYTQRNGYKQAVTPRVHVNLKRARQSEREGWGKRGKGEGKEKLQGEDTRCGQLISHNWKHGFMSSDLERVEKSYRIPSSFTLVFPPSPRSPLFLPRPHVPPRAWSPSFLLLFPYMYLR